MEDPEARRARLKAMREQASQSVPGPDTSAAPTLANPFEEAPPLSDGHAPRFNYYSNPAAGFIPAKRKEPGPPPARPHWSPDFYPPAPVPPPTGPLVGGFGSPIPLYNPMQPGFLPPPAALEPQQRHGDGTWPIKRPNFGPGRGGFGPGRGGFARGDGRRRGDGYQGRGGGRGGGDGYQGRSDGYQGRGDGYHGRGRSEGNQGQGRGRGRGRGEGSVSASDRPDLFYHKSMVEDPWKHLL